MFDELQIVGYITMKTYIMFYELFNQLFLLQTRRAEVKVAVAIVQHYVSFAIADHFSPCAKNVLETPPRLREQAPKQRVS